MLSCQSRRPTSLALQLLALGTVATAAIVAQVMTPQSPALTAPEQSIDKVRPAIGAIHPRVSPNGADIVFSYQGSIWRIPSAGGVMKRLAAGPGFAFEPCWSPDGNRVAFFQGKAFGGGVIKVIDSRTGTPLPQINGVLATGKLFFSRDGNHLIGKMRQERQVEALRALDLKTGELKTLLRLAASRQPWALSDDGKSIVYVVTMDQPEQQAGNDGPQADMWKVSLPDGEPERIVRFPARIYDVCWSPDNKALYVTSDLGGAHNDIWRIDLSNPERPAKFTFGQADEDRPSMSRDGRWLAYTENSEGCPALMLRDLDSGATRPVPIERLDFGGEIGRLRLTVQDKDSGQSLTARAALEHTNGSSLAPPGALWRIYRDVGHFYIRSSQEWDVPAGRYRLRAWHGPEYRMRSLDFEVKAGQTAHQVIALERWTDPNANGWYSGDNHIHANYGYGEYYNSPATMADMCAGEALNICNFMVANSDGDGVFDREYFRGRPDPLSDRRTILYWNEEFRSTIWGHLTLVNLKQVVEPVFTGFKDTTNPNDIPSMSAIARQTHRQGGLVNFTHPASQPADLYRGAYSAKGLPVYAALGKIDTMDVMGSGDRASSALYHRLLNCGFRLTASAGTDVFLNRIRSWLPGGERVYVKVDGPFTYEKWMAGLRAGGSFVTNGPMLELTVDGKSIGEVLNVSAGATVQVRASATAQFPLDRVELLYNGSVAATAAITRGGLAATIDQPLRLERPGWLALRASGPAVADVKGEWVYAHTSPVYVAIPQRPANAADDARYFLRWIDRLWETVQERNRFPDQQSKMEIQAEIEEARKVYRELAEGGAKR